MSPFNYWFDQSIHHFRIVAAIAVQKHNDFAIDRERAQSRAKRPPISALRLRYHASTSDCCNLRRAIGAAIIDDDYFVGDLTRNVSNDFANRLLFVERGDDY